jgi:membrane-bound ClpP family serine protease
MAPREAATGRLSRAEGPFMLMIIGIVLLVLWLLGFLAFHVTSFAIHILLIIGVVLLIMHLLRGRAVP